MPIFPRLSCFTPRFCAIIFLAAFSGVAFSQTNTSIRIDGQSQRPVQYPHQSQTDKASLIARSFGDGLLRQPQNSPQTTISSYPTQNTKQPLSLPTQNPLLPNDVPEEQRRSGVLSMQSHQNILARQQLAEQTPPPTGISQPGGITYVLPMTPPIRQVSQTSEDDTESEATFAALQPPPLLIPPTEPKEPNTAVAMNNNNAFKEISAAKETSRETPPTMTPARLDIDLNDNINDSAYNYASPFLTDNPSEPYANEYPTDAEIGEESTDEKYSIEKMPALLPRKGEQKEKSAEDRDKNSLFGFLPNSASPIMSVLSSLAIVLGVFFVLVWLMKRASPRQGGLLPKEVFEKLGSVPLSPKMHMQLFRLGGKLVLVSVTPDGMEPVAEVTDPDEVIHLIGLCKQNDPKSASAAFRQVLKQYTGENGPQQQQQMTGGYQQPMPMQQYPSQQYQQQTVRRPVGVVRR